MEERGTMDEVLMIKGMWGTSARLSRLCTCDNTALRIAKSEGVYLAFGSRLD